MKARSTTKLPPMAKLPLLNGAGQPPPTVDQMIEEWAGVFEPEFLG